MCLSGLLSDSGAYLTAVDDQYRLDACHSLSIEGYLVSTELIERVLWPDRASQ